MVKTQTNRNITLETYQLRNRIPQNITNEITAREVAKDIIANDITKYSEIPDVIRNTIKYLLIGGLVELYQSETLERRTLGTLFEWMRKKDLYQSHANSKQYFDMIDMVPEQDRNLARFYICDSLMKYQVFQEPRS